MASRTHASLVLACQIAPVRTKETSSNLICLSERYILWKDVLAARTKRPILVFRRSDTPSMMVGVEI